MLEAVRSRGLDGLILSQAMQPLMTRPDELLQLQGRYGAQLTMGISIDHYSHDIHELERGRCHGGSTIDGIRWLAPHGFALNAAVRMFSGKTEAEVRDGFARFCREIGVSIDSGDPDELMLFAEIGETRRWAQVVGTPTCRLVSAVFGGNEYGIHAGLDGPRRRFMQTCCRRWREISARARCYNSAAR